MHRALTRRFHGGVVWAGVGRPKSAPDLRGCGLSKTTTRMFVARDARIPRTTLTRRLKGETPGFGFYELEEICRVLDVSLLDLVKAAES